MIAVIRSEWLKLRTTAIPWVLAGIALVITGLFDARLLPQPRCGRRGAAAISNGWGLPHPAYPHTVEQLRNLLGRSLTGYIFALLLGVLIITVEFRHKTVTTSFLVTPAALAVRARQTAHGRHRGNRSRRHPGGRHPDRRRDRRVRPRGAPSAPWPASSVRWPPD